MASFKKKRSRSREYKKTNTGVIDYEEARQARAEKRSKQAKAIARERNEEKRAAKAQALKDMLGRKGAQRNRHRWVFVLIAVALIVMIAFPIYNIYSQKKQLAEVEKENQALHEQLDDLKNEVAHADSAEYIEQQARSVLQMIKQGETLYVLPKSDFFEKQAEKQAQEAQAAEEAAAAEEEGGQEAEAGDDN